MSDKENMTVLEFNSSFPDYFNQALEQGSLEEISPPEYIQQALASVVAVEAEIPEHAKTGPYLGQQRLGSGVVIDQAGLIATIGYLIVEARKVVVTEQGKAPVPVDVVAYDHETGFGLLRAQQALSSPALDIGEASPLTLHQPVIVAAAGGKSAAGAAFLVSMRPFAGYWEYMLEEALFTTPPHSDWGGSALLDLEGRLVGIGSLLVDDALTGDDPLPGNMFLPIHLLKQHLPALLESGRSRPQARPWLGVFVTEVQGQLMVIQVADGAPADRAGIQAKDQIVKVQGKFVPNIFSFYEALWAAGAAGCEIRLTLLRDNYAFDLTIKSISRYDFLVD